MHPIGALILDLGNVLAFHDNALLDQSLAERAGMQLRDPLLPKLLWKRIQTGELDREGIRKEVCAYIRVQLSPEEFFRLWNSHFRINESIIPVVESLIGQVKLLLLSNTNYLHVDYLRPRLPILEKFDHLLLSHELKMAKPDRAIFDRAVQLSGFPAERTAFFDDIAEYVEAAKAMGIEARVFTTTESFVEQLKELGLSVQNPTG